MIYLDTSYLIYATVAGTSASDEVRRWLFEGRPIGMAAVAWGEFICGSAGAEIGLDWRNLLTAGTPFTEANAYLAAELFSETGRRRGSFADCMIAATVIQDDGMLATTDGQDFVRFGEHGLVLAESL